MKIDVWSDIVCPWCYIGKRRLERAIDRFDEPVEVVWRSFELDPRAPHSLDGPLVDSLARKYRVPVQQAQLMMDRVVATAADEDIQMNFADAKTGNTFDAHRLIHHARTEGLGGAMKERLLRAYFTEGEAVSDTDTLVRLAADVGLDENATRRVLESGAHHADVRADEAEAQQLGAHGVPFFLIDDAYGVSGAQDTDTLLLVFDQVRDRREAVTGGGPTCDDSSCDV